MRIHEIELSRNITLVLFWFNLVKRLTPYFMACVFGGIILGTVFNLTDSDPALKIVVFSQISLVVILIPLWLILWSAKKRHIAVIANNTDIRNLVADYLVKNIKAHRYGYQHFYVELLIKTGDNRVEDCLGMLLKSIFPNRREYAVKALSRLNSEKAVELLKAAIDDKNYDVSQEAQTAYSNLMKDM